MVSAAVYEAQCEKGREAVYIVALASLPRNTLPVHMITSGGIFRPGGKRGSACALQTPKVLGKFSLILACLAASRQVYAQRGAPPWPARFPRGNSPLAAPKHTRHI